MGLFRAFGMAARRWYLLLPLMLAAVGAAYVAYREMPAVYTASVVHQVNAPHPADQSAPSAADSASPALDVESLGRTEASSSEDSYASATTVAGELAVNVQPPRDRTPGAPPPYTVTARPDSPLITVRADADSAERALGTVRGVSARLTAQLATLQDQRAVPADREMRLDTAAPPSVGPPVRTTGIKVFVATLAFGLLLAVVLAAAVERSARRRAELAEGDPDALLDESGRDERPKHDDESSGRDPDPAAAESRSADKGHAECPVEPDAGPDGDERPTQVVESSAAAERAATDRDAPDDGDDAPTEVGALSAIVAPRIRRPVLPPGRPVPPNHPGREAPVRDVVPMWRPVPRGARRHQLAGPPPGQQRSVGSPLVGQQRPLPPRRPVAPPPAGPTPPPARPTPPPAGSNPPWPARSVPPPAVDPLRPPRLAPPPGARPVPGDAPPAVDALRLPRLAPLPDARPMPADAPPTPQPPAAQTPPPAPLLAGTPLERSAASPPLAGPSARPPAPKPAKQSNRRPGEYHPALVSPFGPTDSATFDSSSLWAPARSPLPGSTGFLPATPLPAGVPGIGGAAREAAALEMPVSTLAEDDWAEPDEPEVAAAPPRSARGEASAERGQGPRGDDAGDDSLDWSDFDDLADEAAAEDPAGGSAAEDPANGSVAHPRSGSVVDGRQAGRTTG